MSRYYYNILHKDIIYKMPEQLFRDKKDPNNDHDCTANEHYCTSSANLRKISRKVANDICKKWYNELS